MAQVASYPRPSGFQTQSGIPAAVFSPGGGAASDRLLKAAASFDATPSRRVFQGRYVTHVELEKPESGGLGFSVVGLKSENHGELGIFIQEIQPGSVAHRYVRAAGRRTCTPTPVDLELSVSFCSDGKLREADQILAINGQVLDRKVTHQQAIGILQKASDRVGLTVARGPIPQLSSPAVSRTPSAASTLSATSSAVSRRRQEQQLAARAAAMLTVDCCPWQLLHLETIELVNDGTGLGFGIVGGKTSGVIVKTILPGGIADQVRLLTSTATTEKQASARRCL